jgi:DNA-binding XRE family transcriptional regulator
MDPSDSILNFSHSLMEARRSLKLGQAELAKRVGVSRDLIVRLERGDNVGIHHVLAVLNELGLILKLSVEAEIIPGNFDEFYEKRFGQSLRDDVNPNLPFSQNAALFRQEDRLKIKVKSWKNSAKIKL